MMFVRGAALVVALLVVGAGAAAAQVVPPGSELIWDQPNAATAAIAQAYTFRYYPDAAVVGITLTGVTCAGTAPIICRAPFPAFTPGPHTITLSAANAAGEGPKSAVFMFTFVVVPSAPTNLRSN